MENDKMLEHVGIIMDGNRRWAEKSGLQRLLGHNKGADVFVDTCNWCIKKNINFLTVYAFSTENWKRSQDEVVHIFKLMENFFSDKISLCIERGIKIKVIGERIVKEKGLSAENIKVIENAEKKTEHCNKLNVQIALNYGGRNEIVRAAIKMSNDIASGKLIAKTIDEEIFEKYLDTNGIPDIQLVIRTGGIENRRLSNFLPWQSVYSELYFSDLLWPEFTEYEFDKAIAYYHSVPHKVGK